MSLSAARKKRFAAAAVAVDPPGTVRPALLKQARKSGQLNLANRGLTTIPSEVWHINTPPEDKDASLESNEKWWEQVILTKLILSSNQLKQLSDDIGILSALKVLDLHDNELESLPSTLSELLFLEKLDASHNKLKAIPDLGNCVNLLVLLLQHNNLCDLPQSLGDIKKCEKLDLSHNSLESIPLLNDMNLSSLNLSDNKLKHVQVSCFSSLRFLDLSNNKFTDFPDDISSLKQLEQLYVRNNTITNLPELTNCNSLKEIYVGNNRITKVPQHLPISLSILELRDNKISIVPESIVGLSNLQRLDIGNNNISNLPPEMGNMANLKVVVLDGNPLRSIRRDIISRGTQAVLKYLQSRVVTAPSVTTEKMTSALPESAFSSDLSRKSAVGNTGKLNLSKQNKVSVLESLQEFSEEDLKEINISYCTIEVYPVSLQSYSKSLTSLNLSCNKIKELPGSIGLLPMLSFLDVSTNCLTNLPQEMNQLQTLMEINISSNKLRELPFCLFDIPSIENLLADGNQIEKIPAENLKKIKSLSILSLKNNCISQVPPELALLDNLRSVILDGNTFRVPRQSILQKGPAAVLEYLRSRLPQ